MRALPLLIVTLLANCSAPTSLSGPELAAYLEQRCPRVVVRDGVEVHAALDEAACEAWSEGAAHADRLVRQMLGCENGPPVRMYLLDVEVEADLRQGVGAGGFEGHAFAEDFMLLYVPRDSRDARQRAWMRMDTLRHEIAHIHARRLGLAGPKWFNEGLAQELEGSNLIDGEWFAEVFPHELVRARASAQAGAAALLVGWTTSEGLDSDELDARYALSASLVRFLLERNRGGELAERARVVLTTHPNDVEREWLAWLGALDALDVLARAAGSAREQIRLEASHALPILAEAGVPELLSRRADELALRWLSDPKLGPRAATFLVYFRASALSASDLEGLERGEPLARLAAQVLHSVRNEPVDSAVADLALAALPESTRAELQTILARL